jgi:two-component system KDP operon response regulator KdpE
MSGERVLVVDDEPQIRRALNSALTAHGYAVAVAEDGATALETIASWAPDAVVLDLVTPHVDGFEVLRQTRTWSPVPIIVLSARGGEADKVAALDQGADDYLTKPFGVRELQARILAVTRRHARVNPAEPSSPVTLDLSPGITMDVARREVMAHGAPVDLTRQEFDLLRHLAANRGIVFSRTRLLETAWSNDTYTERTVDTVVSRLRKKLERDPRQPELILTAWGVGYKCSESR